MYLIHVGSQVQPKSIKTFVSTTKKNQLKLFREVIRIHYKKRTNCTNTVWAKSKVS